MSSYRTRKPSSHVCQALANIRRKDGTTLYTTGVDQKIAQFSLVRGTNNAPGKWIHNFSRRWHSHDVRALVTWPSYRHTAPSTPNATSSTSTSTSKSQNSAAPYTPLLLSGGMDMSICICPIVPPTSSSQSTTSNSGQTEYTPLLTSHSHTHPHLKATFENGYYRRMPFGQTVSPIVSVASSSGNGSSKRSKRMILCRSDQAVSLWGISSSPFVNPEGSSEASGTEKGTVDDNPPWEKLAEIALKVTTNLVSSGLSPDGRWIVVGDWYETKLFRVVLGETDEASTFILVIFPETVL
jgi:U3 small nucleolar RNA-associated protein 4